MLEWPHVGSGIVRIDPLCFLAGCRTRRLNQALFVCLSIVAENIFFMLLSHVNALGYCKLESLKCCQTEADMKFLVTFVSQITI